MDLLNWLDALSPLAGGINALLLVLSFLTSGLTSAVGIGGGSLLIMTMAQVMPASALIPVHGMVQLGSNVGRVGLIWRQVQWWRMVYVLPGVVLGALLASLLLVRLPEGVLELTIALFILLLCWGPSLPVASIGRVGSFVMGMLTTFLSNFVGASGPLVAGYLKHASPDRLVRVATQSAIVAAQHISKAFVFGAAGFVFYQWLWLMLLMVTTGFLGTWVGLRFLRQQSNQWFDRILTWVLTLLALRLLWLATEKLIGS